MMRHTVLLILSLLSFTLSEAYPSMQQIADSGLTNTVDSSESEPVSNNGSLDYNVSETTVKGFVTSSMNEYSVQLGAFKLKFNAEAFLKEVRDHIDKNAILIDEDGYYKVRISKLPEPPTEEKSESEIVTVLENEQPSDSTIKKDITESGIIISDSAVTVAESPSDSVLFVTTPGEVADIIFLKDDNPWLKRINYFGKSIAFVNALIMTITISIVTMLILLIIILLNRSKDGKGRKASSVSDGKISGSYC